MQRFGERTYAQHGDDIIMLAILDRIGTDKPSYLDIGAFHPFDISNTALFYERGSRGVNVEPHPALIGEFFRHRPEDINLNCAVSTERGTAVLYLTENPGLSSLKRRKANLVVGRAIIPAFTVTEIIETHCHGCPDVLSIDIEGMDAAVLASLNFSEHRPKVICVESIVGGDDFLVDDHSEDIRPVLANADYFMHSWAGANMIWVDHEYRRRLR